MYKKKKSMIKKIPTLLIAGMLTISGILKIAGIHPMLDHFITMGLSVMMVKVFGAAEVIFCLLFIYPRTTKIGLLLLTGYLGGAIAAEIPFHQVMAPMMPLALVWVAAFVREPSNFLPVKISKHSANLSTPNS
jgi:succinate-acetate transporter protein